MQSKISRKGSSEISLKLLEDTLMFQTNLVPKSLSLLLVSKQTEICDLIPNFNIKAWASQSIFNY